ncbi:MAG: exo-beta-N-acetylmuramidase NamZ domain-containing protein, partial [Gemmatimonadaceae bacterium]
MPHIWEDFVKYPGLQTRTTQLVRWLAGTALVAVTAFGVAACSHNGPREEDEPRRDDGDLYRDQRRPVRTGLTVLLEDSLKLIAGKRVGLITNQTGVDEKGRSGIDLLFSDPRAVRAGVRLVALFSPEHGIRGT